MSNILISLAAEFVGKKAFSDASKSTTTLEKQVKKLGRTLGLSLSSAAVIAYGKASVKAFAEDEAAATRLANAVDNLGISFANPAISKFISELELSAGVADDVLRPAFQALLTQTGSLTQSQKLLNDAITISRASGIELATVSSDLAKGYVGITRGLQKYNTGLSKSELQTKSFSDVLGILLQQSSGAANAYLATTSFKFDVLTVAVGNAQEAIGEGLVNALARAGGGTEVKDAVTTINAIAKGINGITLAVGTAVGGLSSLINLVKNLPGDVFKGFVGAKGGINNQLPDKPIAKPVSRTAQELALIKLEKDAAARAKKFADAQLKAQKQLSTEQKKQAALKKAGSIFDLEQVNLIAALKGKLSDEDRKKVELQLALLTGNVKQAQDLTYEIAKAQGLGEKLAKELASLPSASNPFAAWDGYLDGLLAKARSVAGLGMGGGAAGGTGGTGGTGVINIPTTNATNVESPLRGMDTGAIAQLLQGGRRVTDRDGMQQFTINIDGKAIAVALQDQNLSGIGSSVNRIGR